MAVAATRVFNSSSAPRPLDINTPNPLYMSAATKRRHLCETRHRTTPVTVRYSITVRHQSLYDVRHQSTRRSSPYDDCYRTTHPSPYDAHHCTHVVRHQSMSHSVTVEHLSPYVAHHHTMYITVRCTSWYDTHHHHTPGTRQRLLPYKMLYHACMLFQLARLNTTILIHRPTSPFGIVNVSID